MTETFARSDSNRLVLEVIVKEAWARNDSDRKWVLEVTVTETCARSDRNWC